MSFRLHKMSQQKYGRTYTGNFIKHRKTTMTQVKNKEDSPSVQTFFPTSQDTAADLRYRTLGAGSCRGGARKGGGGAGGRAARGDTVVSPGTTAEVRKNGEFPEPSFGTDFSCRRSERCQNTVREVSEHGQMGVRTRSEGCQNITRRVSGHDQLQKISLFAYWCFRARRLHRSFCAQEISETANSIYNRPKDLDNH